MAKFCPIVSDKVLYLNCLECATRKCKERKKTKQDDKIINENKEK